MTKQSSSPTPAGHAHAWTSVKDAWPEPEDALLFKRSEAVDGGAENWLGAVRGLCQDQEVPILVLADDNDITLAPMVENGIDLSDLVTHWAPWPKAGIAMPATFGLNHVGRLTLPVMVVATRCRRCRRLAEMADR